MICLNYRLRKKISHVAYVEMCEKSPWKREWCAFSLSITIIHLIYLLKTFVLLDNNIRIKNNTFWARQYNYYVQKCTQLRKWQIWRNFAKSLIWAFCRILVKTLKSNKLCETQDYSEFLAPRAMQITSKQCSKTWVYLYHSRPLSPFRFSYPVGAWSRTWYKWLFAI